MLLLQLQELTVNRRLEPALALARRLWDTYTKDQEQIRIAKPVLAILKQAQKAPASADAVRSRLREWRQLLGELDGRKPSPEISAALERTSPGAVQPGPASQRRPRRRRVVPRTCWNRPRKPGRTCPICVNFGKR